MATRLSGEDRLIALIERTIGRRGRVPVGIGDDACVLSGGVVLTTDAYAEGVHFSSRYMTVEDIGRRCACAALSDVVAMAAEPEAVTVALCLPRGMPASAVRGLYRGIDWVCGKLGAEVAGGDIIVGGQLVIALSATGRTRRPRLRSAARPGDTLYVTGALGSAEAGRLVLEHDLPRAGFGALVQRHLCPLPRIAVMRRIKARMRALIDTSDGLATDARHIARASGVGIEVDCTALPMLPETIKACARMGLDPLRFALTAGEDYELLFTALPGLPERLSGTAVSAIGRVLTGNGVKYRVDGSVRRMDLRGFDHLA
ncbi:MAG: thiamine-phosphate kinase [bacterium]